VAPFYARRKSKLKHYLFACGGQFLSRLTSMDEVHIPWRLLIGGSIRTKGNKETQQEAEA
jgi:hypothetical protein